MLGGGSGLLSFKGDALYAAGTTAASRAAHSFAVTFALAFLINASIATPASAQHRRARLSADLTQALATGAPSIDVIVHGDRPTIEATARRYNLKVKRYLRSGAVLRMNAGQLAALRDDEVDHLSSDTPIHSADVTTETILADRLWAGEGDLPQLTGSGIGVAVIDSGVDVHHAALRNRVVASVDFTGGNGMDRFGHGTHVAALIAGQQGRTVEAMDYRGVASGAHIINLRVLGDDGSGVASSAIEAIDWAIEHRDRYNIRILNLSLGAPVTQPYRDDPLCEAAERAVAAGLIVVTAAGNNGETKDGRRVYGGITSPGNDPYVITVGALDAHATLDRADDTVALFSSRGPTMYDLVMKPDLVAPGRHVVSAEASGSYLSTTYPERHITGTGETAYIQLSGTSMAAAVASGTIALLVDQKSTLSPNDAKVALQVSSSWMPGEGLLASGAGSLNALAAAEFIAGSFVPARPDTLTGGVLPTLSGPAESESRIRAQHGVISTDPTATLRMIVFGTTRARGRLVLWGKAIVGSDAYIWGRVLIKGKSGRALGHLRDQNESDHHLIWGSADTVIWGTTDTVIWGTTDTVIWGTADTVIWGTADTVIWGTADTVIWGTADTVIWGTADTVIWGTTDTVADTVIWGTTDTVIWGTADTVNNQP